MTAAHCIRYESLILCLSMYLEEGVVIEQTVKTMSEADRYRWAHNNSSTIDVSDPSNRRPQNSCGPYSCEFHMLGTCMRDAVVYSWI